VNSHIVDQGINGLLADTPEEWYAACKQLIENQGLRSNLGNMARQKIQQEYCLQVTAPRFSTIVRNILCAA
jgi:glycosyltransferase involved in cell wall biosynthesis